MAEKWAMTPEEIKKRFSHSGDAYSARQDVGEKKAHITYTTILHPVRERLGISCNEYVIADTVYHLSGSHSKVPGWCHASKETLGKVIGQTRQGVHKILKRLQQKDLIEIEATSGYLRTTKKWYVEVILEKEKMFR